MNVATLKWSLAAAAVVLMAAIVSLTDNRLLAIRGIHAYRAVLSPVARTLGARCRFTPTCSRYAEATIARDGVVRGGWRALRRIARCGPWTPMGTRDEP